VSQKPPKITNQERLLLALVDSPSLVNAYEWPYRLCQQGLADRLGTAQAHISRAASGLLDQGLVVARRRRVIGQKRRVTTYDLTSKGIAEIERLRSELENASLLQIQDSGGHSIITTLDLRASVSGTFQPPLDLLELADWMTQLESHEGLPKLPSILKEFWPADDWTEDPTSEAILLALELAEIRAGQGRPAEAASLLRRAASQHRRGTLGNSNRDALRCEVAAAALGDPSSFSQLIAEPSLLNILDVDEHEHALILLARALVLCSSTQDSSSLMSALEDFGTAACAVASLRIEVAAGDIDEGLAERIIARAPPPHPAGALQWLQLRVELEDAGGPSPIDLVESAIEYALFRSAPPDLLARTAVAMDGRSWIPEAHLLRLLEAAWNASPPMPEIGHVGFRLAARSEKNKRKQILLELEERFGRVGDMKGANLARRLAHDS